MSDKVRAWHIDSGEAMLWPVDWRLGAARFPHEWRRDRPWNDEETAAHKQKIAAEKRADDELRRRDPFEWLRRVQERGLPGPAGPGQITDPARERAVAYEARQAVEMEKRRLHRQTLTRGER